MKYWRGYLTALIFAGFTWALMEFAKAHTVLIDMVYPYVTRTMQEYLTVWSGSLDMCLWQLLLTVALVLLLASVVLMILLRWNPIQWFGWVLALVSIVFFLHTGMYGLNYYAGPLADDIKLQQTEFTVQELENATVYYRDQANALAGQISRDSQGKPSYPDFRTLAEQAGDGFHTLTYERYMPVFAGSTEPVKELGYADLYTSMGYTGVTMPITGEAAVNPQIPCVSLPFTMCHEMAHRMSIAIERDANFAAFLSCDANSSLEFRYSAYFMAYRYCYSALARADRTAAERVSQGVSTDLYQDMADYNAFFDSHRNDAAAQVADNVNDAYIKTSGDEQGMASYDEVSSLLVSWHIQQVVLPSLEQEEESRFDPLDEAQVDLDGLVRDDG